MNSKRSDFPCNRCGACCRHVNLAPFTHNLDRGDGCCINFDDAQKVCKIYESRPDFCRVDHMYAQHFANQIPWNAFVELNLMACEQLQKQEAFSTSHHLD